MPGGLFPARRRWVTTYRGRKRRSWWDAGLSSALYWSSCVDVPGNLRSRKDLCLAQRLQPGRQSTTATKNWTCGSKSSLTRGRPRYGFTSEVESDDENGGPFHYQWDFGNGSTSSEANPVYTYKKLGEYTVTLVVTDDKGNNGSDEFDIWVEEEE